MSFQIVGKYTTAFVTIDELDTNTIEQIRQICNHPASTKPIAIMPDSHLGKGICIGFTMELGDKVVPNWVGCDIGCGMQSVEYDIDADSFFDCTATMKQFDRNLRQKVPMGFEVHRGVSSILRGKNFFIDLNDRLRKFHMKYVERYGDENANALDRIADLKGFEKYLAKFGRNIGRVTSSLGTLGGGNHFIECSKGQDGNLWITVHTGSRNFGLQVADYHQDKAWDIVEKRKIGDKNNYIAELKLKVLENKIKGNEISGLLKKYDETHQVRGITKIDAFLEGTDMYEYLYDMVVAQTYASWNREGIFEAIDQLMDVDSLKQIETVHNFINFDDFIIRKGAVASKVGEQIIVPFNAKDGILICEGKSNAEWNNSAPHGAGRLMSRSQAKKEITPETAKEVMDGIYASVTPVDESQLCYKDASMIENAIGPTATIVNRLKPVVNFKAK
jgi:tRNA-splicing ligase RtcB